MALGSLPRRLRTRALLEMDALRFRRALGAWRAARPPAGARRTLLISDLFMMTATAKVEALIAGTLEARHGFRSVVLLRQREPVIERIYRAACRDVEFRYFDALLAAEDPAPHRAEAARLLAPLGSIAEVAALELEGFRTGRNALSAVFRRRRAGQIDLADPALREEVLGEIAASLRAAATMRRLVGALRPDRALFNERGYTPAGEVFDACLLAGCEAVQWFGAPSSESLMYTRYRLDNRGMHPMALAPATWAAIKARPWSEADDAAVLARIRRNYTGGGWYNRQKLQEGKVALSPAETRAALDLPPGKPVAVIFAHILYDATFFYGESLFADYQEWLVETVRHAIANPALTWIVKVHPVNVWRSKMDGAAMEQLEAAALARAFGALPDHVRLMPADTPVNTASLYAITDYGLTVRGTVGMELPCFGVPVVTAGTGRYSGLGFTLDPPTRAEFADLLGRLHDVPRLDPATIRLARQHYNAALNLRPQPMTSFLLDFDAGTFGLPELRQNTRLQAASQGEAWRPGPDLERLADWIESRTPLDLLAIADQDLGVFPRAEEPTG
ncbi:hypothetical protein [Rhabdaerophilum calidifontis]|uniref:hypothetical protein n=1 Tax=Rhabdaerophilum calidifontis TaxID=2604328 RepID=UPI00123C0780|nr:hypothetical protein [Rhabdaerophilum calidifontis]